MPLNTATVDTNTNTDLDISNAASDALPKWLASPAARTAQGRLVQIPLHLIDEHPQNPRLALDQETVESFADHLREVGAYPQPAAGRFRVLPSGRVQTLDGHHRVEGARQAAKSVAITSIWGWIIDVDDAEALATLVCANQQTPISCMGLGKVASQLEGETLSSFAVRIGKDRANVSRYRSGYRVLEYVVAAQLGIRPGEVTDRADHFAHISKLPQSKWFEFVQACLEEQWSAVETGRKVKEEVDGAADHDPSSGRVPAETPTVQTPVVQTPVVQAETASASAKNRPVKPKPGPRRGAVGHGAETANDALSPGDDIAAPSTAAPAATSEGGSPSEWEDTVLNAVDALPDDLRPLLTVGPIQRPAARSCHRCSGTAFTSTGRAQDLRCRACDTLPAKRRTFSYDTSDLLGVMAVFVHRIDAMAVSPTMEVVPLLVAAWRRGASSGDSKLGNDSALVLSNAHGSVVRAVGTDDVDELAAELHRQVDQLVGGDPS